MTEMQSAVDEILQKSKFVGDAQKVEVLRVYADGLEALEKRLRAARD